MTAVTTLSDVQTSIDGVCSFAANAPIARWRSVGERGQWPGSTLAPLLCLDTKGPHSSAPLHINLSHFTFVPQQPSSTTRISFLLELAYNQATKRDQHRNTAIIARSKSSHLASPHLTSLSTLHHPSVCPILPHNTLLFPKPRHVTAHRLEPLSHCAVRSFDTGGLHTLALSEAAY